MTRALATLALVLLYGPAWADMISNSLTITGGNVFLSPDTGIATQILGTDPQGNKYDFPALDENASFPSLTNSGFAPGTTNSFSGLVQVDACCGGFRENGIVIANPTTGAVSGILTGSLIVPQGTEQTLVASGFAEFKGFAVSEGALGIPSTTLVHYPFDETNIPLSATLMKGFDGLYHITGAFENPGGGLTMALYDQTSQMNGGGGGVEGNPSAVPEPTTIILLGSGLANLIWRRMKA